MDPNASDIVWQLDEPGGHASRNEGIEQAVATNGPVRRLGDSTISDQNRAMSGTFLGVVKDRRSITLTARQPSS
jgi:hypothetical protein